MYKNLGQYLSIALIVLSFTGCKTVVYNGAITLKDKTFANLEINGHGKLHDVIVLESAKFSSAIEADMCEFNEIESHASIECKNCKIGSLTAASIKAIDSEVNDAKIKNNVIAEGTNVSSLVFGGDEAVFKNCKIKSIKNTGYTKKRVVILIDSEISGDISFESTDHCQVVLQGNSKIGGNVNNARVVHK